MKSDYYRNTNGEYAVRCQVVEHAMPLIDLTVTVPSQRRLKPWRRTGLPRVRKSTLHYDTSAVICIEKNKPP